MAIVDSAGEGGW